MKLLFLTVLLTNVAFGSKAEKCLDQMARFRLVQAVKNAVDQIQDPKVLKKKANEEGFEHPIQNDIDPKTICSLVDESEKKKFQEKRQQLAKSKKLAMRDLQNKKKVSSMIYSGIGGVSDKDMNEAAICEDSQNSINDALSTYDDSNCPIKTKQAEKFTAINVESLSFNQACEKVLPMLRKSYKDNQDCEKQKELDRKPREEISPDKPKGRYNLPGTEEASQKFIDEINKKKNEKKKQDSKNIKSGSSAAGA